MRHSLSLLAIPLLLGCASEGDIDRTQPNKIPKSMFQGQWYMASTVIDVPSTSLASFVGDTSPMEKIVWSIEEDYLIAYRAFEEVPGSDPFAIPGRPGETAPAPGFEEARSPGDYRENAVAVFKIDSHFDIQRGYNSATGEQTNVISEDSDDRPWYEREWLRIDWSENALASGSDDFWFASYFTFSTPGNAKVMFWHQQSEDGADAMRFIDDAGQCVNFDRLSGGGYENCVSSNEAGTVTYFDMVSELLLTPEVYTIYDWWEDAYLDFPGCLFYDLIPSTCGPTRMKARTSFMRVGQVESLRLDDESDALTNVVDPHLDREYEPMFYDDKSLGKFGYFRSERVAWDDERGTTQSGRIYLANVFNLWREVWQKEVDPNGELMRDEAGDVQYRLDESGQRQTIPVPERVPRPVVYHLSPRFRSDLLPAAEDVAEGWNRAFRQAVALAKDILPDDYASIEDVPRCGDESNVGCVPDMFLIDYNGWTCDGEGRGGGSWDHGECNGELAYDDSRQVARLGDLRYNHMVLADTPQLIGPFGFGPSYVDPETGEVVSGQANVYGAVLDTYTENALDIIRVLNGDLEVNDLIDGDYVRAYVENRLVPSDPRTLDQRLARIPLDENSLLQRMGQERHARLQTIREDYRTGREDRLLKRMTPGWAAKRFARVLGTGLEDYLLTDDIAAQLAPTPLGGGVTDPAATSNRRLAMWASPQSLEYQRWRARFAASRRIWLADFGDDAVIGLAEQLADEYSGDVEAMRAHLRRAIFNAVMYHEVGHTVGLRHNFAGSYDSLNYHDQYWELKKETFEEFGSVTPRNLEEQFAFSKQTQAQRAGSMREYQYSSVMDYGSDFNSDLHGLGKYDEAAIAFAYGGHVQAFNQSANFDVVYHRRYTDCAPQFENRTSPAFGMLTENFHYTTVAQMLGVTPDDVSRIADRRWIRWSDQADKLDQSYANCREAVRASSGLEVAGANGWIETWEFEDVNRPIEVPFAFCGDEWYDATIGCHVYDQGADPYEMVSRAADQYWAYYFFNNFRRDRYPFNEWNTFYRAIRRFFLMTNVYQNWLFTDTSEDFIQDDYSYFAAVLGLDSMMRVSNRPQYGTYALAYNEYTDQEEYTLEQFVPEDVSAGEVVIPRGPGRSKYAEYDFFDGGYIIWDHVMETAHYWDGFAATMAMTWPEATVVGVDAAAEAATYSVPFDLLFPDILHPFFGNIWVENNEATAPRIDLEQCDVGEVPAPDADLSACLVDRPLAPIELTDGDAIDPRTGEIYTPDAVGIPIRLDSSLTLSYDHIFMGMMLFGSGYDTRFQDRSTAFLVEGESFTPEAGYELITCDDIIGGQQWAALRKLDGTQQDNLGTQLIERCNRLSTFLLDIPEEEWFSQDEYWALDWTIWQLQVQRGLHGIFGSLY